MRKLEFLLGEALSQHCDSVITIGGLQSNHVRATVLAAREVLYTICCGFGGVFWCYLFC